jgi:hypothetical protein
MTALIVGLSGTATHQLGVVVYRAHHDDGTGCCVRCARRDPCPARRNAAELIVAAGDDPRRYHDPPNPAVAGQPPDARVYPDHEGFPVDGRGRWPWGSAGWQYERDDE